MKTIVMLALFALIGCGGGGGSAAASSAPAIPTVTLAPLTHPTYAALGDSITEGLYAADYVTQGYAAVLNSALSGTFTNLGLNGESSANIIVDEVPKIPPTATLITIFIGTNDELAVKNGADPTAAGRAFAANFTALLSAARAAAPQARVYAATVPNMANLPAFVADPQPERDALSAVNAAINTAIKASGVCTVDLASDPAMYDVANYRYVNNPALFDPIHPNTNGHAHIAAMFQAAVQTRFAC